MVPGSPLDPRSCGGNKLIKEGAYLLEGASDITQVLQNLKKMPEPPTLKKQEHILQKEITNNDI